MSAINWIVQRLSDASDFFYDIYLEVNSWIYPFYLAANLFYQLCLVFNRLAWDFYDFGEWVADVTNQLRDILSWSTIRSYIRNWLPNLESVIDWWSKWRIWIGQEIDNWWSNIWQTVKSWIDIATEGLDSLKVTWNNFWNITFPQWTAKLDTLKGVWDNFWTVTFPTLVNFSWLTTWWNSRWKEVDQLINSRIKEWSPFFEGWQDWKDRVTEFFTDPEEWLYKAVDRIFERFW